MKRARTVLAILSAIGLSISVFAARPSRVTNFEGWGFAILWVSAAWCLVLIVLLLLDARRISIAAATGSLLALCVSELILCLWLTDPMVLAVKPIYQLPIATIGAAIGYFGFHRRGAQL